jgi:hypothetical protein
MARLSFTAGLMMRRHVRFKAASLGLKVQEFKGALDSGFVVDGDGDDVNQMFYWLQAQSKGRDDEAQKAIQGQLEALGRPIDPLLAAAMRANNKP